MEEIYNKYWCDKCRCVYDQNILDEYACPNCGVEHNKSLHMVLKGEDNQEDIIVVTQDNYKNVLPKDLIYFYNQAIGQRKGIVKVISFSLSRNAISLDEKKFYKTDA